MRVGNARGEPAKFNTRSQVTELGLGATASDAGTWKVNYDYGELNTDGTTVNAAKNTGNIAKQTLTIPGTSFVQAYRYDPLYRLTEAKEKTGTTDNWTQTWSYDRYGNRLSFNQNISGSITNSTPSIDSNTNRFVTTGTNFQYDLNGNLVRDSDSRQFKFSGDNKQTEVRNANGAVVGKYFYDGEGKRVRKQVYDAAGQVTEETVFVYSSGKLVAEYSTTPASQPSVNFTTTDHLGSPRVITDGLGQIKSRRDFMPFGEDVASTVGSRSTNTEYAAGDELRQKFTGYQKDGETGLDFAEARMYENRHGRFTAVDPLLASGKSANPQTFNRYVYVVNRPLAMTDPTGLDPWWRKQIGDNRFEYKESKDRPGEDWGEVPFDTWYFPVGQWNDTGQTAYLYKGGGQDMGEHYNRVTQSLASLGNLFGPYSTIDPKQIGIRDPEMSVRNGQFFMGMFGSMYNNGATVVDSAIPRAFGAPLFTVPYYSPSTPNEQIGFWSMNIATIMGGGASGARAAFATKADEAVFYSGQGAKEFANATAVASGGKTINGTFGGAALSRITETSIFGRTLYERNFAAADGLWRWGSGHFAREATGNVRFYPGYNMNPSGVWRTVEQPILLRNPSVNLQRFSGPLFMP